MYILIIIFSKIDEYGFERPKGFDYISYDKFMTEYVTILVRRAKRWEQLLGKSRDVAKLKKSSKLERFVHKGVPMSLRGSVWMNISGAMAKKNQNPDYYNQLLSRRITQTNVIIEQVIMINHLIYN